MLYVNVMLLVGLPICLLCVAAFFAKLFFRAC